MYVKRLVPGSTQQRLALRVLLLLLIGFALVEGELRLPLRRLLVLPKPGSPVTTHWP